MMFSRQTQKLLFMFVAYSFIGYFLDMFVSTKTWAQTGNPVTPMLPSMAFMSFGWGLAAVLLYYVLKMKKVGQVPKLLMASVVMILIGCAMRYGQAMIMDPINVSVSCITGQQILMWILIVLAFSAVNKPLLKMAFGKKGAN